MLTKEQRVPTALYVRTALVTVVFAVGAFWLVRALLHDGLVMLASIISAVTVFLLVVYLRRRYSAMRWMAIGVAFAALFGVYPILFNVYIGFTNMGDGHLFSKQQSIERLESEQFLPEGASAFAWAGYQSGDGYAIVLTDADPPRFVSEAGDDETVELDPAGEPPATINGYRLMAPNQVLPIIDSLAELDFGDPDAPVRIQSFRAAAASQQRYRYDAELDAVIDLSDGVPHVAQEGSWVGPDGASLVPGFISVVGDDNFVRFLSNDNLRTPLLRVLVWNFAFAFFSVALELHRRHGGVAALRRPSRAPDHPRRAHRALPDPGARVGADLAQHAEPGPRHDRQVPSGGVRIVATVLPRLRCGPASH